MKPALKNYLPFILLFFASLYAEEFKFKLTEGESYRIHSSVNEKVFVNGIFSHNAEIINRIVVNISDVRKTGRKEPLSALYTCTFMTTERNSNTSFNWGRQYPSVFRRDEFGFYTIDSKYFMPVVRDVPVFPQRNINAGEKWTGQGIEAHDFRDVFKIQSPFLVPFSVNYTYQGHVTEQNHTYHLIIAEYTLDYTLPEDLLNTYSAGASANRLFPLKTKGTSKQKLYWDSEAGNLSFYTEEFAIRLILNTNDVLDYVGSAKAELTYIEEIKTRTTDSDIQSEIENLNLKDTRIEKTDEGLTISLDKINFESDSAVLAPSEKEKLKIIGMILKKYPERELLISGHTALAGTSDEQQKLSEERAAAVAAYLAELQVREYVHMYTRGLGSSSPIAPNDSEENMAKNRRVEITILNK